MGAVKSARDEVGRISRVRGLNLAPCHQVLLSLYPSAGADDCSPFPINNRAGTLVFDALDASISIKKGQIELCSLQIDSSFITIR